MNPNQIDREQTQGDLGEQDEENQENQRPYGTGNQTGGQGQLGQQDHQHREGQDNWQRSAEEEEAELERQMAGAV